MRIAHESIANDCIHEQIKFPDLLNTYLLANANSLEDAPLMRRSCFQPCLHPHQMSRHMQLAIVQVPRRHHPAAAIASRPAQHEHTRRASGTSPKHPCGKLRQASACILHHLQELDAILFDHQAIHFFHLINAKAGDFGGIHMAILRIKKHPIAGVFWFITSEALRRS